MFGAIKHGLVNVANFHGRDARQTFWYYVLFVVILNFCAGLLISIPMTAKIAGAAIQAAQSQGSEAAIRVQTMAMMTETLPMMAWMGVITGAASMILLLASTVRRLHDSGLSGWLILVPGLLYAVSLVRQPIEMQRMMDALSNAGTEAMVNPALMVQQGNPVQLLLAWVPALIVIFIGVRKSDGPNRFGEAPVRF